MTFKDLSDGIEKLFDMINNIKHNYDLENKYASLENLLQIVCLYVSTIFIVNGNLSWNYLYESFKNIGLKIQYNSKYLINLDDLDRNIEKAIKFSFLYKECQLKQLFSNKVFFKYIPANIYLFFQ